MVEMAIEIERKFLVANDAWRRESARSQRFVQGYLTRPGASAKCSVRVRIGEGEAWLNVKAAVAGVERREFEYAVPADDAATMIEEFCDAVIEKVRHHV